jgi:cytochrome P450
MPFGFGSRMCIGRRFAELEIETLVTKVWRHPQLSSVYRNISLSTCLWTQNPAFSLREEKHLTVTQNKLPRRIFRFRTE